MGASAPLIKVGTIKRAKGLEFEQMLLPQVDGSLLTPAADGLDEGALKRREIERRELYVGMTPPAMGCGLELGRLALASSATHKRPGSLR